MANYTLNGTITDDGITAQEVIVNGNTVSGQIIGGPRGEKGDKGDQGTPGVVQAVVAGTGISVDDTDPANPIVTNTQTSANWGNITGTLSSQTDLQTALDDKVDKVPGKGLSTNDYTTLDKNKLAGIADGAEVNVNADWNASSGDAQILNKPTLGSAAAADTTDFATAAQGTKADNAVPTTTTVNGHALSSNVTVSKSDVGLGNVTNDAQLKASDLDTDGTLAANSDTKVASQKATKTYVDTKAIKSQQGLDASKPSASSVISGSLYFSADINGGTLYESDGSTWAQVSPGVDETSGMEVLMYRYGGTATTGTTAVLDSISVADITDAASTFTMPANGRPISIIANLPLIVFNYPSVIIAQIWASVDGTNWKIPGAEYFTSTQLTSGKVVARLPFPTFDSSASSPYTLTPGSTVYIKMAWLYQSAGNTPRGAWSSSMVYVVGDGVSYNNNWYYCTATRTATATTPAADTSHWTKVAATQFRGYQSYFGGYIDNYIQVVQS